MSFKLKGMARLEQLGLVTTERDAEGKVTRASMTAKGWETVADGRGDA